MKSPVLYSGKLLKVETNGTIYITVDNQRITLGNTLSEEEQTLLTNQLRLAIGKDVRIMGDHMGVDPNGNPLLDLYDLKADKPFIERVKEVAKPKVNDTLTIVPGLKTFEACEKFFIEVHKAVFNKDIKALNIGGKKIEKGLYSNTKLRHFSIPVGSRVLQCAEQNPNKETETAIRANQGHEITWFFFGDGEWLGRVEKDTFYWNHNGKNLLMKLFGVGTNPNKIAKENKEANVKQTGNTAKDALIDAILDATYGI